MSDLSDTEQEVMDEDEFIEYLHENFDLDVVTMDLIYNIFHFVQEVYPDPSDYHEVLWKLLDSRIGLERSEIDRIIF